MIYYNDNDKFSVKWLKNLMDAGLLPKGEIDDREIQNIPPKDVMGFTQAHFFAGIGGWAYALQLAGVPTDYLLWTGSCPCQAFSEAGTRAGGADRRHLWPAWFDLIRECQPPRIFGEQVASKIAIEWLDSVFDDLESIDYTCGAASLPASSIGAPHIRQRLWFFASRMADSSSQGLQRIRPAGEAESPFASKEVQNPWGEVCWQQFQDGKWRPVKPGIQPVANGVSSRMGKLRGIGNAIVPPLAAEFIKVALEWEIMTKPFC